MTPDQINRAIAEECGPLLFVMVKHGLYYRPNACGYTGEISLAGRWAEDKARKLECSKGHSDEVKAVPAPVPDYHGSLDAMALAEKTLTEPERLAYHNALCALMDDPADDWSYWPWHAKAPVRAEAFLRVRRPDLFKEDTP